MVSTTTFTLVELFCILHMIMKILIYILGPGQEVADGDDNISAGSKVRRLKSGFQRVIIKKVPVMSQSTVFGS